MAAGYIVCWDDDQVLCVPMGWDTECAGALSYGREVAWFPSRAEARKAVRISTAYAKLCKAQGKPANSDFLGGLDVIKIMPLSATPGGKPKGVK